MTQIERKYRIIESVDSKTGERIFYPQYMVGSATWCYIYEDELAEPEAYDEYGYAHEVLHRYHKSVTFKSIIHEVTFDDG